MTKKDAPVSPEARLPKGLFDISAGEIRATEEMLGTIRRVFESYGFEPLDTPAIEYTDALGKFLPDQDRPNEGVFSFKDDDEQWLSLRYDLTAPLARYVAENFQSLPKPFRRYQSGPVWRNEKPGPGRYRQFTQFDADTVGASSVAADAELCMLAADTLEALGLKRGQYVIKVNNRKVLEGLLDQAEIETGHQRLVAMRAIDKLDRLGLEGVRALLGEGRKDESGDFTKGADLGATQVSRIMDYLTKAQQSVVKMEAAAKLPLSEQAIASQEYHLIEGADSTFYSGQGMEGEQELERMRGFFFSSGYGLDRIRIDPSVVRGLEYYTGPVFEADLTAPITDEKGQPIRLGSVVSGGRYDGLVER
ncbi:MAG: histidine--tRNA ligase, partial [Alphaproteobacteria bacterium RBG_16_64_48]